MDSEGQPALPAKQSRAEKFSPGCFKKSTAFFLDQIIIALLGMGLLYPFSGFMASLGLHAWLPGYILGALYYMVLESRLVKSASLAKMVFSLTVRTVDGAKISPFVSLIRYICITLPFYNNAVSQSIASSVGITNTSMGGTAFLVVVGLLFVGNTLFMVLHPQKRGVHDLLCRTVVVPADTEKFPQVQSFTKKPVLGGIVGLLILGLVFGNLYLKQGKDPDFTGIDTLAAKVKEQSGLDTMTVSYRKITVQDKSTVFSIDVHVPVSFEHFSDSTFTGKLADSLFPLVKKLNTNPKVNTITLVFHTRKYIGAFPISKYSSSSREIDKIHPLKTKLQE